MKLNNWVAEAAAAAAVWMQDWKSRWALSMSINTAWYWSDVYVYCTNITWIRICSTQWLCQHWHLSFTWQECNNSHWLSSQEIENCSDSPIFTPGPRQLQSLYKIGLWGHRHFITTARCPCYTESESIYRLYLTWTKLSGGGNCILHLVQSLTWSWSW